MARTPTPCPMVDLAPRVDDHAVPVSTAAARMHPALSRRNDVRLVLDGAGAQQRFPVSGTGGHGEGRGNEHGVEIAELAIELGKAHIVANRQREAPEGALHRDRALARLERARLVVALVARLEAEQMHFVVACHPPPGIVEHQAGAADAARVRTRYGGGAADYPDAVAPRGGGEKALDRAHAFGLAHLDLVGFVPADEIEVLGQRHQPPAATRRPAKGPG